ncbi:MurR/RpiR family transcriptional regulator [Roseomonas sp. 18066]|uniref:MurR/RpiR family transcriptional regulator n=1 Tax=Roseomonas sp. 18066 TaxID=2681412 RepID=UPI00135CA503|nr:MurR/RpiR family transcriptional regulator [Roseomonas sp. 18066]
MTPAEPVSDALAALLPALSGPIAAAARHILAHPEDVAVFSMRELARRMEVPPATLVRLAQRLGFARYDALRQGYVEGVRQGHAGGVATRNRSSARALAAADPRDFAEAFLAAEQEVLRQALRGLAAPAVEEAVALLAGARRVHVAGRRTAFSTAYALAYTLHKARPDVVLVGDMAGVSEAALQDVVPGDVLVVITAAPFSRPVIGMAERAAAAGARIIAIVEAAIPPLKNLAGALIFIAPAQGAAFPESTNGALAIANLLVARVVARLGAAAERRIAADERRILASGEFLLAGPRSDKWGRAKPGGSA